MSDMNSVVISGQVSRAPELKYTPNGKPVANFDVSVAREFDGKVFTDRFSVSAFGKEAEFVSENIKEGDIVGIQGRLGSRTREVGGSSYSVVDVVVLTGGVRKFQQ